MPAIPARAYAVDQADLGSVHVVVENTTSPKSEDVAWEGTLVDDDVALKADSTGMTVVVDALTAKGYTQTGAESNYISEINGLAAFDGGDMSGWMCTLNDWFTNSGFGDFTVANGKLSAGDEVRVMYTTNGYGEDLGGSWSNSDKTVKAVSFSAGELDKAFDKDAHAYTLTVPEGTASVKVTPTASNKNYQVRASVGGTEYKRTAAIPVADGTVITVKCGDPAWPSMNGSAGEAQVYTFTVNLTGLTIPFAGTGTEEDPYILATADDLVKLSTRTNEGEPYADKYFKMVADIELPADWAPIGTSANRFKGNIDGNGHLLTVPADGLPLLGATESASISNLDVYGERIAGNGLVNIYTTGSSKPCILIKNVTLKSGTSTLKSGFIGGYASGSHAITIEDCTIEEGVTIGYDGTQSNIGAFAGELNGTVRNCVSHATVKGVNFVGGIVADKGQSMGDFVIENCTFDGTVEASGNYAGGILGAGYAGTSWGMASSPNTPAPSIIGCTMAGTVKGVSRVGGILGGDGACYQAWDNGIGTIKDNVVTGAVEGETETGAVIGFLAGLNVNNVVEGNSYAYGIADKGIGRIEWVDTAFENPTAVEGTTYLNSGDRSVPLPDFKAGTGRWDPQCFTRTDQNRDDDPLGVDAEKLCKVIYTQVEAPVAIEGLVYNGKAQTGVIAGEGYTVQDASAVHAGAYTAVATLEAGYCWTDGSLEPKSVEWAIAKAKQSISVTKVVSAVNYNGTLSRLVSPLKTVVASGNGALSYALVSGDKGLSVVKAGADAGKVKVAAKVAAGTYQATVRVRAAATADYEAASKDVVVTVQVKRFPPTITVTGKVVRAVNFSKSKAKTVACPITKIQCASKPMSYALSSAKDAGGLTVTKKFSVDALTGAVTVKAGTLKGTYKVNLKISSAETPNYKGNWRIVSCTVKVV